MKPSKKLMRDFAKVVLPEYEQNPHEEFNDEFWKRKGDGFEYKLLSGLQTVVDLAKEWCDKHYRMMTYEYMDKKWRVAIYLSDRPASEKDLSTAIMKAVVEAAKK